jgi:hypothetical protein
MYIKLLGTVLLLTCLFFLSANSVIAAEIPTPAASVQVQWTNEFTVENKPSTIVTLLKTFIESLDTFLGGFIFYTPDTLGNKITLHDGAEIPGVTKYRNIFNQIAIPIIAIVIAGLAFVRIGSDNTQQLKSFATRFVITIALFLIVPTVLSYSIQLNNLLVKKISEANTYTTFLQNYFDKSEELMMNNNESSEKFGIPSFDISLQSGIFKSLGKFIVQVFLFAITFLFLLGGLLYIGFQFVIRFATLLFLSVLYPIIIPFALSDRTEQIVHTYFKTWFTFLIQQPAFVLGLAIATDIFNHILQSNGPSAGMLFFFSGFLFFLAGVNTLVTRIFGDAWTSVSNNLQATVSSKTTTHTLQRAHQTSKGLISGSLGFAQQYLKQENGLPEATQKEISKENAGSSNKYGRYQSATIEPVRSKDAPTPFAQELSGKGLQVEVENKKQGIVSVTGEGYAHHDGKNGLTAIYSTRLDAIHDGVPENELRKIQLDKEQFIDLSSFNKQNPSPHHLNAMQEAQKAGKSIDYAYVKRSSPPHKVKNFLELAKERNDALGIQGVVVQRHGLQSSDTIIRLYTTKKI